jgi:hypothetical protein
MRQQLVFFTCFRTFKENKLLVCDFIFKVNHWPTFFKLANHSTVAVIRSYRFKSNG